MAQGGGKMPEEVEEEIVEEKAIIKELTISGQFSRKVVTDPKQVEMEAFEIINTMDVDKVLTKMEYMLVDVVVIDEDEENYYFEGVYQK